MPEHTKAPERVTGQIKWFDLTRGFGFILDDSGGPDILLHANILRNFGQNSISDGSRIEVSAAQTVRGLQAVEILSIEARACCDSAAPVADLLQRAALRLEDLPFLPARVKWFDKGKGFGFANIFGEPGDVFLHIEVLRHSGFADVITGEAVALRVVDGPRGRMGAQIGSWDRAMAQEDTVQQGAPASSGLAVVPVGPAFSPVGAAAVAQAPRLVADPAE